MAYEVPLHRPPVGVASADLSGYQFRFVTVGGSGVALATAGQYAVGVLQNKPLASEATEVECTGTTKLVAGEALDVGDAVMSDATGRGAVATAGNLVQGIVLEAAANANELCTILLRTFGTVPTP
jgi:hypothetical protein